MRVVVLNNYVDQAKYAPEFERLCTQVKENCDAEIERMVYQKFDVGYVKSKRSKFDAIVMSGSEALYSKLEDRAKFFKTIEATREIDLPLLGICGGHQLMGMAYGEKVTSLGKAIKSYRDVDVLTDDPIFEDLPKVVSVMEAHEEMVEKLPVDFKLLARSTDTSIEAFRKSNQISYGLQFHPERNDAQHSAGAVVLANFGRLVKR
ncbi:MAG: gamma-glutamyl-gamma-aminobutyrate hydrolase family protein [Candidatus Bathyarchaeia archaeon]